MASPDEGQVALAGSYIEGDGHPGGAGRTQHARKGHRKSMLHANLAESLKIRQVSLASANHKTEEISYTVAMASKCKGNKLFTVN